MSNTNNNTMSTEKIYIGKGRQKQGSEYITLRLDAEELHNLAGDVMRGGTSKTITLVVARLRSTDKFGRTHTCYLPQQLHDQEAGYNRVADQQEIEVRAHDEANA